MIDVKKVWKQDWQNLISRPNNNAAQQWHKVTSKLKIQPKVFLDVGAGEFGSEAWEVKKTHPDCKIIGFEPQPQRFEILKQHNYPGLLLPFVINKTCGMTQGYMGYPDGKSDFWLFRCNQYPEAYKEVNIESFTLDYLEQKHGPFDNAFIWADVEGSELSVLQGSERLFNENKIIGINVEVRESAMSHNSCTADQIIAFLKNKQFFPTEGKCTAGHYDMIFIPSGEYV